MTPCQVKRFVINNKEIDLVYLTAIYKIIPIPRIVLNKMFLRGIIPPSIFVTTSPKAKRHLYLITIEHLQLLLDFLTTFSRNYTKVLKATPDQIADLHKKWANINDTYCRKLGLPMEYGLEFVTQEYKKFKIKSVIAMDILNVFYYNRKANIDIEELKRDTIEKLQKGVYNFNEYDMELIEDQFDYYVKNYQNKPVKPHRKYKKGEEDDNN